MHFPTPASNYFLQNFSYFLICKTALRSIKNREQVIMRLKRSFSNHCLMVRLNLSLDSVRNCKKTTKFVKECEKIIECKKKGILSLVHKQGLLFEKSQELCNFRETYKKWRK